MEYLTRITDVEITVLTTAKYVEFFLHPSAVCKRRNSDHDVTNVECKNSENRCLPDFFETIGARESAGKAHSP